MKNVESFDWQFGDRTYTLSALTMGDLAAFRDHLRRRKIEAARSAYDGLPEKPEILGKILRIPVSDEEVRDGMTEVSSVLFLLHRSLSKKNPGLTLEATGELVPVSGMGELGGLLSSLMGGGAEHQNPPTPPETAAA